jgi:hypothetical protein
MGRAIVVRHAPQSRETKTTMDDMTGAEKRRRPYQRPTRDQMEARLDAIFAIVEEIEPCGVRQAFYQTTVRGLLDKTEASYDKVQRALVKMRRSSRVPYG